MEQNWLDLMPADVTNEITHQYARSVREDLHAELRAELLREIPGEGVWVDNPTLYHRLALDVYSQIEMIDARDVDFIIPWLDTLELDIFERIGLESVLVAWQEQLQLTYNISYQKKRIKGPRYYAINFTNTRCPGYYAMSFINMLPYQSLLSLKHFLNVYQNFN